MEKKLWNHILTVRERSPLVHNITNFVVMNNTANTLLAIGASPIMAHAPEEIDDMVDICGSIVINIGTLSEHWLKAMLKAASKAMSLKKPWILDPVGAGATSYRNAALTQLLDYEPTVIRGNASEIMSLAKLNTTATKGVDSTQQSNEAIEAARLLNDTYGAVVCVSGETDIIVTAEKIHYINNGDPLMTKVTGLGCSATAVIGAFIAVIENKTEATAAATALFSLSGQLAAQKCNGPGSLQMHLLDELYSISAETFAQQLKYNVPC